MVAGRRFFFSGVFKLVTKSSFFPGLLTFHPHFCTLYALYVIRVTNRFLLIFKKIGNIFSMFQTFSYCVLA